MKGREEYEGLAERVGREERAAREGRVGLERSGELEGRGERERRERRGERERLEGRVERVERGEYEGRGEYERRGERERLEGRAERLSRLARNDDSVARPARVTRLSRSFRYALSGIGQTFATQANMRIHGVFAIAALVACGILRCTPVEWAIVIALIGLVFAAEMFNTAIESTVDLVTRQRHPLAKRAKDVAAGAVLVLAIAAVAAGLVIYLTAFLRLLGA